MSDSPAMLSVNGIEVIYNHVILVLKGVSLTVREGSIVALLGANGAGKTTTLRAISNLLKGERGEVTKGYIEYMGERIERLTPSDLVKRGVVQVMEGRRCFAHLSVEENLLTGAYTRSGAETASGLVKFQQWDGAKWKVITDWMEPDRKLVRQKVEDDARQYAKEKSIEPRDCAKEG